MSMLICPVLQVVEQRQFASCVVAKLYAPHVSNNAIRLRSKSRSPVDLPPDNARMYRLSSIEVQQTSQLEVHIV